MVNGDIYLKERDIAVVTPVGESETLCVLQVARVCCKKNVTENIFIKHYSK